MVSINKLTPGGISSLTGAFLPPVSTSGSPPPPSQQGLSELDRALAITQPGTTSRFPSLLPQTPSPSGDEIVVTGRPIRDEDQRVRLKPFPAAMSKVLGPNNPDENILAPLYGTNGVLFTYTPSVQFNQDVDWKSIDVTHSNYETAAYSRTPAVSLTLSGKFTVQTHAEGRYLLAVLHFFRVVSKMYFGVSHVDTSEAGVPPPILLLKGYGDYMFNDLRVIVKNHTYPVDDTVDLVQVRTGTGRIVTLPSILTLSTTLQVVQSPKRQKDEFDLDKFRTGSLMSNGGGWI